MDTKPKQLSELIKSGEYYEKSRDWYRTIYIGPISERGFFLIIAFMASVIAVMGFMALFYILPITDRPGIMISNTRMDDAIPKIVRLKEGRTVLNEALQQFFIKTYVTKREGYRAAEYDMNYRFIRAQSDENAFEEYAARYDRNNLKSPAAILGAAGSRVVTITSVELNNSVEPRTATVEFSTDIQGINNGSHANWTAVLQYYYNDMVVTSIVDPITQAEKFETQDPQFKVVHYALTQAR